MKLIVGLGNPGPKYETTRHNVGFLLVDHLVDRWRATGPSKQYQAEIYKAEFEGESVWLVKPQTFMNLSGRAVGPVFGFYRLSPSDLIVAHDDLDLKPMAIRLKTGGGSGGHNGLKSIDEGVGKEKNGYHRVRLGIGRPLPGERISPADYVLQPYRDEELKALEAQLEDAAEAVELILRGQMIAAQNKFHSKV